MFRKKGTSVLKCYPHSMQNACNIFEENANINVNFRLKYMFYSETW